MSRLLEDASKKLLSQFRIPVPRGKVVATPEEARQAAQELGGAVALKALVPVGKRGKAGAVRFAASPEAAAAAAQELLKMKVYHFPVEKILVEERVNIAREIYACVTYDPLKKMPVVIASSQGGVDVEEVAATYPEKVVTKQVDPYLGLANYQAKEIWCDLGLKGDELRVATDILWRMYQCFEKYDATIVEVNPLAVTGDGKGVAAGVLMAVDDDALYRHPDLASVIQPGSDRAWRPLTDIEKYIIQVDAEDPYRGTARYTELEGGDIGFLCGGGGGSLLMFDTLRKYGGRPANYTEFGGNPPERKMYGLTKGILSKPGLKGFFLSINITNNTQVDLVAEGLLRALKDMNIDVKEFPIVIRMAGVNEPRAKELLEGAGVPYHGDDITMEDAARMMVERMRQAHPSY
ncbi:MAG: acetate--CoA ligase family protein [Chloroflexi bacterium]|nr:acetate--CoA ligase family protein [Chloroflexota bacterium]